MALIRPEGDDTRLGIPDIHLSGQNANVENLIVLRFFRPQSRMYRCDITHVTRQGQIAIAFPSSFGSFGYILAQAELSAVFSFAQWLL